MDLVISVAVTAPRDCSSAPLMADTEMPTSCEFCSRFCAVTTIFLEGPGGGGLLGNGGQCGCGERNGKNNARSAP